MSGASTAGTIRGAPSLLAKSDGASPLSGRVGYAPLLLLRSLLKGALSSYEKGYVVPDQLFRDGVARTSWG